MTTDRLTAPDGCADLGLVHPELRRAVERGLRRCHAEGLAVFPFEGLRRAERQSWLYALGRTIPGKVVTNAQAGESFHHYGLAVDFAFDRIPETPKVDWTWDGNWELFGQIMMDEGLEWYGAPGSRFREAPHVQLSAGFRPRELLDVFLRGGLDAVWLLVDQRLRHAAEQEGT